MQSRVNKPHTEEVVSAFEQTLVALQENYNRLPKYKRALLRLYVTQLSLAFANIDPQHNARGQINNILHLSRQAWSFNDCTAIINRLKAEHMFARCLFDYVPSYELFNNKNALTAVLAFLDIKDQCNLALTSKKIHANTYPVSLGQILLTSVVNGTESTAR